MADSSDDEINGMPLESKPNPRDESVRKSTRIYIPKCFNRHYVEYTENTTIHGVKYLGEPRRPWAEKIFWIIIFLCCFCLLGYFMEDVITKWIRCPTILVEDELPTPMYKTPFPAVTICPQIKSKYDKFSYELIHKVIMTKTNDDGKLNDLDVDIATFVSDYFKKMEIASQVCHGFTTKNFESFTKTLFNETIDSSYIKLLYELSPTLNETIDEVEYKTDFIFFDNDEQSTQDSSKDKDEKVRSLFSTVLTNEGVCFTFNVPKEILREKVIQKTYAYNDIKLTASKWDSEHGYKLSKATDDDFFPLLMYGAGKEFGLQIQLKSLVKDMNRLCQPTQIGFKIVLHSPSTYPTTYEDYILVNYESITNIAVKPDIIKTSESLRMYSPHRRQCYFANERRLKYFEYYNKVNCKLECLSNYTMQNFNCVHYSLPMEPGTNICGAKAHGAYSQMYNYAENMKSLLDLLNEIDPNGKFDQKKDLLFKCDCLPECNSIKYAYDIEVEPIDYYEIAKKVEAALNTTMKLNETFTEINIFIKDTEMFGRTRNQLYTFSSLVSNFGGLMGLFMGASILSMVELIYFCIIRQSCKQS